MTIHEIIKHYAIKVQKNEISFSEIRNELQYKNIEEEKISEVIRLIDYKAQRQMLLEKEQNEGKNEFILGMFALVGSLTASILSFLYANLFGGVFIYCNSRVN